MQKSPLTRRIRTALRPSRILSCRAFYLIKRGGRSRYWNTRRQLMRLLLSHTLELECAVSYCVICLTQDRYGYVRFFSWWTHGGWIFKSQRECNFMLRLVGRHFSRENSRGRSCFGHVSQVVSNGPLDSPYLRTYRTTSEVPYVSP